LILTEDCIYACRDKFGRTPIIIGKNPSGYAVASESSSFSNLGYSIERDIAAGEAVKITKEGCTTAIQPGKRCQICSFLCVYYGYPSSYYEGINVEEVRYRCGAALAKDDDLQADFVAGIPDSGIGHAVGYSHKKCIPYKRPFVKYTPTWPRSFMPQTQSMRNLVSKMKLIPNEAFTKDSRIVFMDDSIVRGTQLKDNVVKLREFGVKEVHIRVACPPILFPCCFLNFSTSRSSLDLIARRAVQELEGIEEVTDDLLLSYADPDSEKHQAMLEKIRQDLQLDSLKYQRLSDLIEAIGLPKEQLCTHCWDKSSFVE
jgi:amidophosphoribosyltransferase